MQDDDLVRLSASVRSVLNIELALSPDIVDLVCRLKPYQATFVPERREEITTEGGLDLSRRDERLSAAIDKVKKAGVHVSLFIDPTPASIRASAELGVPAVELHTGRYSHTWRQGPDALEQLRGAAVFARQLGLAVHAGHGLTYRNVEPVAAIPEIEEVNIGHSIVSRAVMTGMVEAVSEMGRLLAAARRLP